MKSILSILLFYFLVIVSVRGQSETKISEADLFGCWIMEKSSDKSKSDNLIYKRCEISDTTLTAENSRFSLLALNKSEIQTDSQLFCFKTITESGTWSFDDENKIVTIYYKQELLKDLKLQDPEEYAKFDSPEKLEWMKFEINKLSKNQMVLKKIRQKEADLIGKELVD